MRYIDKGRMSFTGKYKLFHIRNGIIINSQEGNNVITNEGRNTILDSYYHGTNLTWAAGITNSAGWAASINSTSASHGWTQANLFANNYPTFTYTASGVTLTVNKSAYAFGIRFDCTTAGAVDGAFIMPYLGGSPANQKLWSEFKFTIINLVIGDILYIDYTITGTFPFSSGTGTITTVGRDDFYNLVFVTGTGGGGLTTGLIVGASAAVFAVTDTNASHPGWTSIGIENATTYESAGVSVTASISTDITTQLGVSFTIPSNVTWRGSYIKRSSVLFSEIQFGNFALTTGDLMFYDYRMTIG